MLKAHSKKGITGDNLMYSLEMRLDNIVFRMGFAWFEKTGSPVCGS